MATHSSILAWKFHGQRSLVDYSPWGQKELGRSPEEGNGNPFHYSHLGNPMDREAWRATVHGVARVGHDLATQ